MTVITHAGRRGVTTMASKTWIDAMERRVACPWCGQYPAADAPGYRVDVMVQGYGLVAHGYTFCSVECAQKVTTAS